MEWNLAFSPKRFYFAESEAAQRKGLEESAKQLERKIEIAKEKERKALEEKGRCLLEEKNQEAVRNKQFAALEKRKEQIQEEVRVRWMEVDSTYPEMQTVRFGRGSEHINRLEGHSASRNRFKHCQFDLQNGFEPNRTLNRGLNTR